MGAWRLVTVYSTALGEFAVPLWVSGASGAFAEIKIFNTEDPGEHGVVLSAWSLYLSTYLANIFSGSMAMKIPRLRAKTSSLSLRISAVLM